MQNVEFPLHSLRVETMQFRDKKLQICAAVNGKREKRIVNDDDAGALQPFLKILLR